MSMTEYLLITPDDPGTPRALSGIAQGLANQCPSHHSTTVLHGMSATRKAVESALPHYAAVIYFGHGKPDALETRGQALIDLANEGYIQGVLIAIACHAADGLGASRFGRSPSRAFLGFNTYLIHPCRNSSRANDAYEQALGGLFFGATVQEVAENLRVNLLQAAQDYKTNRSAYKLSRGDAIAIFGGLRSNVLALVCHGNAARTLKSTSEVAGKPREALAALRLTMDHEIFQLSGHEMGDVSDMVGRLSSQGVIRGSLAGALVEYMRTTNELLHAPHQEFENTAQALSTGAVLSARLHRISLVERLVDEMSGHAIWHLHPKESRNRYLHWAVIASEAPIFEYSYEILAEAAKRINQSGGLDRIRLPTMREFIEILKFRLSELQRLRARELRSLRGNRVDPVDDHWRWPDEWNIPWNGPIGVASLWGIQDQIFLTSRSIERYRQELKTL
ncbi:hypothetical protein [Kitasatospora sp. Ki12]